MVLQLPFLKDYGNVIGPWLRITFRASKESYLCGTSTVLRVDATCMADAVSLPVCNGSVSHDARFNIQEAVQ